MDLNEGIVGPILGGGGFFLALFLTAFFFYGIFRNVFLYVWFSKANKPRNDYLLSFLNNLSIMILAYTVMFILGTSTQILSKSTDQDEVLQVSLRLISIETSIFKVLPAMWFHDTRNTLKPFWDQMAPTLLLTYNSLGFLMGVSWLFAIYISPRNLYRLTIAWILTTALSLPIWYLVPAISPQELIIDNALGISLPDHLREMFAYFNPIQMVQESITYYDSVWNSNKDGAFAITSFPSMHVAWATILMYYMTKNWKYLSLFFVPYWVLTCISTVYTLQHYAIDVPAGILIGALSIFICERFLKEEPKAIRNICVSFKGDVVNIIIAIENSVSHIVNNFLYKSKFSSKLKN